MIEVFPNLFVGSGNDLIHVDDGAGGIKPGWFVISAAKEPWHREALGYAGRGAPKDHPEYLFARRERRLICNLIDANDPAYISEEIVTDVLECIDTALDCEDRVLLHCNQGHSRAPMLALLWMRWGDESPLRPFLAQMDFDAACIAMQSAYPGFDPAAGMVGFARAHWEGE